MDKARTSPDTEQAAKAVCRYLVGKETCVDGAYDDWLCPVDDTSANAMCHAIAENVLEAIRPGVAKTPILEPVAWQWRYIGEGDHQWKTPSGGQKISDEVLKRERPIEQRPLYAVREESK